MVRSEERIRRAILHPDREIRQRAVRYFAEGDSADTTLMLDVIEAIRLYGMHEAFTLLRIADDLPQSPESVDWLIGELNHDLDMTEVVWDNYAFAIGLLLQNCDPQLLIPRRAEILQSRLLHSELAAEIEDQIDAAGLDWQGCWNRLEESCSGLEIDSFGDTSVTGLRHCGHDATLLARRLLSHPSELAESREFLADKRTDNVTALNMMLIRVGGMLRDEGEIPYLLDLLERGPEQYADEVASALGRIGTDQVVIEIGRRFPYGSELFRDFAFLPLRTIRTELSFQTAFELFDDEWEEFACWEAVQSLAGVLLSHFDERAVEPVWECATQLVDEIGDPDSFELFFDLLAVSTILECEFPDIDDWRDIAEQANWGKIEREPDRLSDSYFEEKSLIEAIQQIIGFENLPHSRRSSISDVFLNHEDDAREDAVPGLNAPIGMAPATIHRDTKKIGRNEPCPCGSGKKYKKCCQKDAPNGSF